jgi:hypothetical protein
VKTERRAGFPACRFTGHSCPVFPRSFRRGAFAPRNSPSRSWRLERRRHQGSAGFLTGLTLRTKLKPTKYTNYTKLDFERTGIERFCFEAPTCNLLTSFESFVCFVGNLFLQAYHE